LKPGYHCIGARVETRRLQATGKLGSTFTPPHQGLAAVARGDLADGVLVLQDEALDDLQ
jgi:hypothetical protein